MRIQSFTGKHGGPSQTAITRPVRARHARGAAQKHETYPALSGVARALAGQQHSNGVCAAIPRHAARLFDSAAVLLYVFDRRAQACELVSRQGVAGTLGTRVALGHGLVGRVASQRRIHSTQRYDTAAPNGSGDVPARAATVVPLLHGDELTGVLVVIHREAAPPLDSAGRQLLGLYAALAAGALHNARMLEQVRAGRKRLEVLSRSLLESLERERRRLARELHDEIGQMLTALHLNLENLRAEHASAQQQARLEDSLTQVERLLRQVRNLALELRPSLLDDLGLAAALRWYLERQAERSGLRIAFANGLGEERLASELETTCFRVAQEAVNNIVRHAQACNVRVNLSAHEQVLELSVLDDGCGFDADAALKAASGGVSLGLLGMQEWVLLVGGRFEITSTPGRGSKVSAFFPRHGAQARLERRAAVRS